MVGDGEFFASQTEVYLEVMDDTVGETVDGCFCAEFSVAFGPVLQAIEGSVVETCRRRQAWFLVSNTSFYLRQRGVIVLLQD
jgi:hypothetical protein